MLLIKSEYTEIFDGTGSGHDSAPSKLLFEGETGGFVKGKKSSVFLFPMICHCLLHVSEQETLCY